MRGGTLLDLRLKNKEERVGQVKVWAALAAVTVRWQPSGSWGKGTQVKNKIKTLGFRKAEFGVQGPASKNPGELIDIQVPLIQKWSILMCRKSNSGDTRSARMNPWWNSDMERKHTRGGSRERWQQGEVAYEKCRDNVQEQRVAVRKTKAHPELEFGEGCEE